MELCCKQQQQQHMQKLQQKQARAHRGLEATGSTGRQVWGVLTWSIDGGRSIAARNSMMVSPRAVLLQEAGAPKDTDWSANDGASWRCAMVC